MKRYFNEKPEDDEDEDKNIFDGNDDDDEDGNEGGDGGIIIDMDFEDVAMQIDLMHTQLKERLLAQAKDIARQDIWWWFRSPSHKTRVINKIFKQLVKVIYEEEENKKG
jgi:hypothetical protein